MTEPTPPAKGAGSTPTTNDPAKGGAATGSPPSSTFDVKAYRKAQDQGASPPTQEPAPRGPKVKWADLAGLDGFAATDPFEGVSPEFGPWSACTIVAPDGKTATAISSQSSGPGAALHAAIMDGRFDEPKARVPIHVRTMESTKNVDPKTGKPFVRVLVTFG